jgi:hypothetical protein
VMMGRRAWSFDDEIKDYAVVIVFSTARGLWRCDGVRIKSGQWLGLCFYGS